MENSILFAGLRKLMFSLSYYMVAYYISASLRVIHTGYNISVTQINVFVNYIAGQSESHLKHHENLWLVRLCTLANPPRAPLPPSAEVAMLRLVLSTRWRGSHPCGMEWTRPSSRSVGVSSYGNQPNNPLSLSLHPVGRFHP